MSDEASPAKSDLNSPPAYWSSVYAMALCSFILVASEFMPVSLLTPMAADLHLTEGQAGQSVSICSIAALITSLAIRNLAGAMDRRLVLLFLTSLLVVSGPLVAFAPNYTVLLAGRILVGIALGGFWSLSAATAMRLVPSDAVPRALAMISSGTAIAGTVAAPLGSFIGGLVGWRGAFFCLIPIALVALIWQVKSLPRMPSKPRTAAVGIIGLMRHPNIAVGYLGAMVFFAGQYSLFTYLRPFLEQITHAGLSLVSTSLLVVGVMGFVGTAVIGRLIGKRLHLSLAVLASTMGLTTLGLTLFGAAPVMALIFLAIWGFCGTAAQVAWWAWVTRAAAADPEAGGGLLVAVAQVGITSGATLGGLAFDSYGPLSISFASAVALVCAATIAFFTGRLGLKTIPNTHA